MSKKKKHVEEHENLERWLVSYADFITLLFAFFTVLYALSQTDKTKYKNAVESIQRAFMSAGGVFPLRGSPFTPFEKAPDKGSVLPPSLSDPGKFSRTEQPEVERVQEQIRSLFEQSTGLGTNPGDIEVEKTEQGFRIRLGEHILFNPDSDKLKREHVRFLYEMGKQLARMNLTIQIEGHTDNMENRRGKTNWEASLDRSYNVMKFMVEGSNFPKNKISLTAYGDSQPIGDNATPEGRRKNRRVEIAVLLPDRTVPEFTW